MLLVRTKFEEGDLRTKAKVSLTVNASQKDENNSLEIQTTNVVFVINMDHGCLFPTS